AGEGWEAPRIRAVDLGPTEERPPRRSPAATGEEGWPPRPDATRRREVGVAGAAERARARLLSVRPASSTGRSYAPRLERGSLRFQLPSTAVRQRARRAVSVEPKGRTCLSARRDRPADEPP